MVNCTQEWSRQRGTQVACRVGVHHGPCVGGIVGCKMQRYHLFGKLLSIVEGLESSSIPHQVQVSKECKAAVEHQMFMDDIGRAAFSFEMRSVDVLKTSK